ncbi:hypothetical protein ACN27G_16600 [Plantactinospora sp. WMMB334]|uniref:hypothetical protein n=1 Tax=Plantactinospora sp. WMMB334 TaxID=3404119 RepID=UPI003B965D88
MTPVARRTAPTPPRGGDPGARTPPADPARRGGRYGRQEFTVSLIASGGECFLVANAAENLGGADWSRLARRAFAAAGRALIDGVVVLSHEGARRFGVRYFGPDGGERVPPRNGLRCAARLVGEQYGYRDLTLSCGSRSVPARVADRRIGVHLGPPGSRTDRHHNASVTAGGPVADATAAGPPREDAAVALLTGTMILDLD